MKMTKTLVQSLIVALCGIAQSNAQQAEIVG